MAGQITVCNRKRMGGFTLVEMIGVLAIIAILVAALSPKIFDAISDSRVTSFVSTVKTIQTSVTKYYSDVGALLPMNATTGAFVADAAGTQLPNILTGMTPVPAALAGGWFKFRGPYLDRFAAASPAIGNTMIMPAVNVAGVGAAANANNVTNYDLNNDGNNDFTAGSQIVSIQVVGISQREFEKVDAILDEGIGTDLATKSAQGRVKWQNVGGGTLRVYIAHK